MLVVIAKSETERTFVINAHHSPNKTGDLLQKHTGLVHSGLVAQPVAPAPEPVVVCKQGAAGRPCYQRKEPMQARGWKNAVSAMKAFTIPCHSQFACVTKP